jgi:hypothetical protein
LVSLMSPVKCFETGKSLLGAAVMPALPQLSHPYSYNIAAFWSSGQTKGLINMETLKQWELQS